MLLKSAGTSEPMNEISIAIARIATVISEKHMLNSAILITIAEIFVAIAWTAIKIAGTSGRIVVICTGTGTDPLSYRGCCEAGGGSHPAARAVHNLFLHFALTY